MTVPQKEFLYRPEVAVLATSGAAQSSADPTCAKHSKPFHNKPILPSPPPAICDTSKVGKGVIVT